jgi:hypothetical protein
MHSDRQFVPMLVSGAGHDALMMAHLTKVYTHTTLSSKYLAYIFFFSEMIAQEATDVVSFCFFLFFCWHVGKQNTQTKVGMLFVRCTGGISHSPDEHVLDEDVWAASHALHSFLVDEITADHEELVIDPGHTSSWMES